MSAFDRFILRFNTTSSIPWVGGIFDPSRISSIDAYLNGANLVILAPTAGGKTEAAFFPILSQMLTESWDGLHGTLCEPHPCSSEQPGGAACTLLSTWSEGGPLAGMGTRRKG